MGVSSLVDTWFLLRNLEANGERNRGMYVLKSRGMAHSNQIREFTLSAQGIQLRAPYIGAGAVLTGSARLAQEALDRAKEAARSQETSGLQRELERKQNALEAQIAELQAEHARAAEEFRAISEQNANNQRRLEQDRQSMEISRQVSAASSTMKPRKMNMHVARTRKRQ